MAGFGWHKKDTPPGSIELAEVMAPYYRTCIELFGADRCMFESNFPVDRASCSYSILWNAFKRLTQDYTVAERGSLFLETASRVYSLDHNQVS
jgi:predicted TIM-barrel fold metal-dependent hydrolase